MSTKEGSDSKCLKCGLPSHFGPCSVNNDKFKKLRHPWEWARVRITQSLGISTIDSFDSEIWEDIVDRVEILQEFYDDNRTAEYECCY